MPSMDNQGSSMPFVSFPRPIMSIRGEQVHSMESNHDSTTPDSVIESFQNKVSGRFHDLSAATADEFLSVSWIQKLLDVFIGCQEEFRVILCKHKTLLSKPPLDRLVSEFFDRSIKALDICNAIRDGIEKFRLWQRHIEIVLCALDPQQRMLGEGQFRRASKALMDLPLVMLDEKDAGSLFSSRNRSFGHNNKNKDHTHRQSGHSRSLSWSVSHSWSASKQLQTIANNLVPPRGSENLATNGLAFPVYTMSFVLMFVLWVLVAAIPCQDRGLQIHFSIPRQLSWATPLYDRIMDESKKRERRNSNGFLKEIYQIEKCVVQITDLVDSAKFPLTDERNEKVRQGVQELSLVYEDCKKGLDLLDRQLREVFCKIMSCRTEGLEFMGQG